MKKQYFTVERGVRAMAGSMVLVSLVLSLWSPWWLLLTAFVGANLLQSAFTGICPAEAILGKLGLPTDRQLAEKDMAEQPQE